MKFVELHSCLSYMMYCVMLKLLELLVWLILVIH